MVAYETQKFILVRGVVHANPYFSCVAALVFVCSITGVVAPSYEVDGIGGRLDPKPEVLTLLYIGRRGRVIKRAIRLTDCFLVCYNRLILAIVQIRPPWFPLIPTLVDCSTLVGLLLDGYWANNLVVVIFTVVQVRLAHIFDTSSGRRGEHHY
jgi:hypothetical protein